MVRSQTTVTRKLWTCSSCLRAQAAAQARRQARHSRAFTTTRSSREDDKKGAMSRRLSEMAEETLDTGSKSDQKLMADAFSADLKRQLEERIAQTTFAAENQQAILETKLPSSAGRGTRDQATAKAWTGIESTEDAAFRMLDDAHKKLRMPARKPTLAGLASARPKPKQKVSVADRLANARERTSIYALQQEQMSEEERAKFKQELKDRFTPGARPMPTTLQGLTSLANERIEDAIARGQFKNIQRGKGVNIERDYNASSPFLDTTEYFMNKIIQKQEIVPPWIEKQQELMKMARTFRQRLRNDWRRHAARTISSRGGSLEDQMRRAKAFALAEERYNPRPVAKQESMSAIDPTGMLTTVTIEERIAAGVAPDPVADPVEIKVTSTTTELEGEQEAQEANAVQTTQTESVVIATSSPAAEIIDAQAGAQSTETQPETVHDTESATQPSPAQSSPNTVAPMAYPFRDPAWERTEAAYHTLAIREINDLARSYNLMAPKIAQKPYYNLQRELNRCYAEVAPTLADEILNRSRKGPVRIQIAMHREGSLMDKFKGTGHVAKVKDEPGEKGYGFKEFWRDLFAKEEGKQTI